MSTLTERNARALGWDYPAGVSASTFDGEPECPACAGDGKVNCPECAAKGCEECHDTGLIECDACDGSGVGPSARQLREEYEADRERDED